jgi:signal peptidase I
MRSRPRKILTTVGLVVLVGAGVAVWPSALGGATTYVSTVGSSMEPTLHHDDLVLVRPAPHYEVGDMVAYRSELLDTVVLHRIVDRDGDRFILKGDHNPWLDNDQPARADLIGEAWLTIPNGGRVLGLLRTAAPALAALLVLAGTTATARTARRRTRTRSLPAMPTPSSTRRWRNATIALAATAGASLLVGYTAFSRPAIESAAETLDYTHRGEFAYSATAPTGPVYDQGQLRTGDPIFLNLVRTIAIEFDYELDADAARSVTGTIALHAEIEGANGWHHDLVLGEPTLFGDTTGTARAELNIAGIEAITEQVELLTGVDSGSYGVTVVPHVTVEATVGGEPLDARFDPRLEFTLDAQQLRLNEPVPGDNGDGVDLLAPVSTATINRTTQITAQMAFRDWGVPVATARSAATAVGALAAIGALIGAALLRRRLRSEVARIELRYGDRLVPITEGGDSRGRLIVDVTTMADLARLAQQHDTLILQHQTEHRSTFFFDVEGRIYRYIQRRPPGLSSVAS